MKRPLLAVALVYVAGLLLAHAVPVRLGYVLPGALGLGWLAALWPRRRGWLLGPLILLTGVVNLKLHTDVLSPHDLRFVAGEDSDTVAVRGRLTETPAQRMAEHEGEAVVRTLARVEVQALQRVQSGWQAAYGQVMVSTPGVLPAPFWGGQTVEITGMLRPPAGPLAEGLFDYRTYLRHQGIHYQLQVESPGQWRALMDRASPPLTDRFAAWARSTLARGLPVQDEPLELLWAMTLGWRTALTGEVSEPFMRSGTMHVFAISGLHIALISGILVSLLRVCRVPRSVCGVVVIPLVWFYTAATGWQSSAIRATIMMTVIITGWSLSRPSDLLNSLAGAALLILLWEPQQLFQASFQLSFSVVFCLALFGPILQRISRPLWEPDPLLPEDLRPRWQRCLCNAWRWVLAGLVTSFAAWIGSMPIIAHYFHLCTPVSLLANLCVVVLSGFAVASSLGSLIVGAWLPAVSELFNHSAWFFMWLMTTVSKWAAGLPGGSFHVRSPSAPAFLLYYGTLVAFRAGWLVRPRWRWWTWSLLGIVGVWWLGQAVATRNTFRLHILPLKGGQAIYLDAPGSRADLLVDCGDESTAEAVVKPFLRAQGVDRLPALLLTHGDVRHVGGAARVGQAFRVRHVLASPVRFRSVNYRRLLEQFQEQPGRVIQVDNGVQWGPWTILHPDAQDRFALADDSAVVLLGEFHGTRVLLLADLGTPGQDALLRRHLNLRADLVVSGLPVRTEPVADALLKALQPQLVVIADAEYPATARASAVLRERLARHGFPMLYTRDTAAVTLTLTKRGWKASGMNGVKLSGKPMPP